MIQDSQTIFLQSALYADQAENHRGIVPFLWYRFICLSRASLTAALITLEPSS